MIMTLATEMPVFSNWVAVTIIITVAVTGIATCKAIGAVVDDGISPLIPVIVAILMIALCATVAGLFYDGAWDSYRNSLIK